jgi:hypothetical protein
MTLGVVLERITVCIVHLVRSARIFNIRGYDSGLKARHLNSSCTIPKHLDEQPK